MQDIAPTDVNPAIVADARLYGDEPALQHAFAWLREHRPVAWATPEGFEPFWLLSRAEDIRWVERQPALFAAGPRNVLLSCEHEAANLANFGSRGGFRSLVALDGVHHQRMRAITQEFFLPKNVRPLKAMIDDLAGTFVDDMIAQGDTCDFAGDVAFWFPLRVVMTIMGVSADDEAVLLKLTQELFGFTDPEYMRAGGASAHLFKVILEYQAFFEAITQDRQRTPRNDLCSVIANATLDGEGLDPLDRLSYYVIMATAGHDTTSASIAGGLRALIDTPEALARLRADPAVFPSFTAEAIRWTAPVKHFMRTAQESATIAGQAIAAGQSLMLHYGSACRDERAFPNAGTFMIDRNPNAHLAFGYGPHQCLGQFLATMEIEAFHRAFWERIASVEMTAEPDYVESPFVSGIKRMPIRFTTR